jgi:type I restriction enzyme, S subunit
MVREAIALAECDALQNPKRAQASQGATSFPRDWSVVPLGSVSRVTSGKRLPLGTSLVNQETKHPYIRVSDMRPGRVATEALMFVPESVFPAIKNYRIYKDDLFISVAGTLGIVGEIPESLHGANLTENADRITDIRCSKSYLLHVLLSPHIQDIIADVQTVGAQPKLALERIRDFPIPLPPSHHEQDAIAEVLSDVDACIELTKELIKKKRFTKHAAMQELLSGELRLPEFDGKWRSYGLGCVVQIRNEKIQTFGSSVAEFCVDLEDICQGTGELAGNSDASNRYTTKYKFLAGDVLFGRLRPYLRKFWYADRSGVCSTEIWPLIPNGSELDSGFLRHVVQTDAFIEAASAAYGTHMPRADWKSLSNFVINLPPTKAEQSAIAEILTGMDRVVAALENKLEKVQQIKQGLAQILLTGRVRLV